MQISTIGFPFIGIFQYNLITVLGLPPSLMGDETSNIRGTMVSKLEHQFFV